MRNVSLEALYPAMDSLGQCLYLLCMVAMTIRGWWRKQPLFYWIQAAQFGEMLWILNVQKFGSDDALRSALDVCFWPDVVMEMLVIANSTLSWNRSRMAIIGLFYAIHAQAMYLHFFSYNTASNFNFGWEYAVRKLANVLICPAILWTLYSKCGTNPQESTNAGRSAEEAPLATFATAAG